MKTSYCLFVLGISFGLFLGCQSKKEESTVCTSADYTRLYDQAQQAYDNGQYAEAATNYRKAGLICPNCTDCATKSEEARVAAKAQADQESQARVGKETDAIYVAGGTFEMGSNQGDADAQPNEMVQGKKHRVEVGSFYMAKYEVTQAQWRAVMGRNPPELYNTNCDNCPVDGVSYKDVTDFWPS